MIRVLPAAGAAAIFLSCAVTGAPLASAERLGEPCNDWMKLSTDRVSGEQMVCAAAGSPATELWWRVAAEAGSNWGDLPHVGAAGTPCSAPPYEFGQSADGYVVWCLYDYSTLLLPGERQIGHSGTPAWSVYAP
jgi:hypothetical protein